MDMKDYQTALSISQVMLCFTGDEPAPLYWTARAYAAAGKKKQAEKFLTMAAAKGLTLTSSIRSDQWLLLVMSRDEIENIFKR